MRKNKILPLLLVAAMTTTALTACSSTPGSSVENSKKPLVWFNRQPSNSSTEVRVMNVPAARRLLQVRR